MNNKKKGSNINNNVKVPTSDDEHYFLKFPRTRHLFDAGGGVGRDDLLMDPHEMKEFLKNEIVIEEKVDGANLGISMTEDYKLQFQNRSHWVTSATATQWKTLDLWVQSHPGLFNFLNQDLILFGEWMYAKHSIHYTDLPDTFLAFDIWNKKLQKFLSVNERDKLLEGSGIQTVRNLGRGVYTQDQLAAILNSNSEFYNGPIEGVYLRIDDDANGVLKERAKVVRHDFLQTNEEGVVEHWTKTTLVKNIRANSSQIKFQGNQIVDLLSKSSNVNTYTQQLLGSGSQIEGEWVLLEGSLRIDCKKIAKILPFIHEWKASEKQPQYFPDEEEKTFAKLSEFINQISHTVYSNITQWYHKEPQAIAEYCESVAKATKAPWLSGLLMEPLSQVCENHSDSKIPWSYFGLLCSLLDKCLAEFYLAISASEHTNQPARLGTVRMYRLLLTPQLRTTVPPPLMLIIRYFISPFGMFLSLENSEESGLNLRNMFWHGYLGGEVEKHHVTLAIVLICSLYGEVSEKVPSTTISGIPQVQNSASSSLVQSFDGKFLWNLLTIELLLRNFQLIQSTIDSVPGLSTGRKAVLIQGLQLYQQGQLLPCLVCLIPQIEFLLRMLFIQLNRLPLSLATSGEIHCAYILTGVDPHVRFTILDDFLATGVGGPGDDNKLWDALGTSPMDALLDLMVIFSMLENSDLQIFADGPRLPMAAHLDSSTEIKKDDVGLCVVVLLALLTKIHPELSVPAEIEGVVEGVTRGYVPRYHPSRVLSGKIEELSSLLDAIDHKLAQIHEEHYYPTSHFDQQLAELLPQTTQSQSFHIPLLSESQITLLQQICIKTFQLLDKLGMELEKQIRKLDSENLEVGEPPSEEIFNAQKKLLDLFSKTVTALRTFQLFGKVVHRVLQNTGNAAADQTLWKQIGSLPNALEQTSTKLVKFQWEPAIKGVTQFFRVFEKLMEQ